MSTRWYFDLVVNAQWVADRVVCLAAFAFVVSAIHLHVRAYRRAVKS